MLAIGVVALALAVVGAASEPAGTSLSLLDPAGRRDVAYGPFPEQLLDVHRPADAPGPVPAIVFAHPGGFVGGSRKDVPRFLDAIRAQLRVAIVSIEYRLVKVAPDGSTTDIFPAAVSDLDRAIRFTRLHAVEWGLDPQRIILAGGSAGGHLVALAAADPGHFADPALPPELARVSPAVQGVIDYVGPTDFRTFWQAGGWAPGVTTQYLGCAPDQVGTCDAARVEEATVATHLRTRPPPAYFLYGAHDALVVPATQGAPLAEAWARRRGEPSAAGPHRKGTWYDELADVGHNVIYELDPLVVESWLSLVLDGTLR